MIKFYTIITLQFIFFLSSCHAENHFPSHGSNQLVIPSGETIPVEIASASKEHSKGLSGRKTSEFPLNHGMLFYYQNSDYKRFWMPDTYFNLDLFFLDENFKVINIVRNLKAHPGFKTPPEIATTQDIWCRHVLEMRSSDPFSKKIKVGMTLNLKKQKLIDK